LVKISISLLQKRSYVISIISAFGHFLACFRVLLGKNAQKYMPFEQKLTDVSGSQRIVYFLVDLHLPETRTQFAFSTRVEIEQVVVGG